MAAAESPKVAQRAAIYARYSSDLQKPTSIDDQLQLCREHAAKLGAVVTATYSDPATSGASLLQRPGARAMLADAKLGRFDVVVAEAQDRLSRSLKDIADIFERLSAAGVTIVTVGEGEISELHIGLKGTMNAIFLKDLAKKVRRGQRGQVERGRAPGGLAYGYRVVHRFGPDGQPIRGLREIDPDQAAIVKRIFAEFVSGRSAKSIAQRLNHERVSSARGGAWNASTIAGNKGRANGILRNRLYLGELTYGKTTNRKDPDTGRKRGSLVTAEAWTVTNDEALRIIDDRTWESVQKIRKSLRDPSPMRRRPKRLLSGLLGCGCCGGPYIIVDSAQYGCASNKEGRGCENTHRIASKRLEALILDGIAAQLLHPDAVSRFIADYHDAERTDRAGAVAEEARRTRQLGDVDGKIRRMVDAIAAGADVQSIRQALIDLEEERAKLKAEAEAAELTVVRLQPHLADAYRRRIEALAATLTQPLVTAEAEDARQEALQLIRPLIERVILHPTGAKGRFKVELTGDLMAIFGARSENVREASPHYGVWVASPTGFEPVSTP
ncbi:recombinase family protein [Dongia sedimenti]|uniref:recombinase family protein n=1 Tax=Dongia sedimenti TaxID=3064282 RepID=UPI0036D3BA03